MAGYNTTVETPSPNVPITFNFPRNAGVLVAPVLYFVLYNQSPYILSVQTPNDIVYCGAFTADIYQIEASPTPTVVVTPVSNLGSDDPIASQVYGTFYDRKADLPLTTFPASLFGSTESIAVDRSVLLDSADSVDTTAFYVSPTIDVTRYQSYILRVEYEAANAGPPANTLIVRPEWYESSSSGFLHSVELEVNSVNSTDCGATIITDRMYGKFMRLVLFTGNGPNSTATYRLFGSNRPAERLRINEIGDGGAAGQGTDQCLVLLGNLSVGAGITTRRNCRLGHGQATLLFRKSAAGGPWGLDLHSPDLGSTIPYLTDNVAAGAGVVQYQLALPRRALTLAIANTGGAAGIVWVSLVVDTD